MNKNILFMVYVIMIISAISTYGIWLSANNIHDEWTELAFLILIGCLFLFSLYRFIVHRTVICGFVIFILFSIVASITYMKETNITNSVALSNGTVSRNLMLGLGLGSLIPVLVIQVTNFLSNSNTHK